MKLVCPDCKKEMGQVESTARLILTVHCPFCGKDFGAGVDPPAAAAAAPATTVDIAPPA
jgi:endogenous inhibitor of DNA gyrase (YacG/DUF329 family)